jgi:hypothetical protein
MGEIIFSGVTGMTLPYNVWGCDYYGNNCILITTINSPIPPTITITLPPIFDTYIGIRLKVSNCVNCDYSEFIPCFDIIP